MGITYNTTSLTSQGNVKASMMNLSKVLNFILTSPRQSDLHFILRSPPELDLRITDQIYKSTS